MSTSTSEQPTRPVPDGILILAVSLFLTAVYLATPALYPRGLDEMNAFAVGRSLQGHLSFDVDSLGWTGPISGVNAATVVGVDGHTYTPEDVAASVAAAPFIKLAYLTGASPMHAAHLSTILVTVLTAAMIYLITRAWGYGQSTRILAMLVFGLASQAWPWATSLMNNVLTGLGLTIAVWGATQGNQLRRWRVALLGGLGMSLAGLSTIVAWVALPAFFVTLVPWEDLRSKGWREVIRAGWPVVVAFGVGAAVGLATGAVYNIARYGSPVETGMAEAGNLDFRLAYLPVGLFGLLFSAPVGLVWFAPYVLLAPSGVLMSMRGGQARRTVLLISLIVLFLLLYGSYFLWWAATLWGPRYLIPVGPCFVLLALPVIDRVARRAGPAWARALATAVLAVSALTQLIVALLDFGYVSPEMRDLLAKYTPPVGFMTELPFLANPGLLPGVQAVSILKQGGWSVRWALGGQLDWPVMAAGIVLVGLAGVWLWIALRRPGSRLVRPGLAAQAVLCVVFAGALLARYPHSPVPFYPRPPDLPGIEQTVAYIKREALPGDGVITLLYPTDSYAWHDYFDSSIPDIGLTIQTQLDANARVKLDYLPGWRSRVWLVSDATTGANPDNAVERYLARHAFVGAETWFENWRVVPYTLVQGDAPLISSGVQFSDQGIALKSFSYMPFPDSGREINVRLQWQTTRPLSTSYSVFVHLLDSNGKVVAQHDGQPVAGYAPTSSWGPGQTIDDRHALLLPLNLQNEDYHLTVGLYDPSTGARLPLAQGGDALTLQNIPLPPGYPRTGAR